MRQRLPRSRASSAPPISTKLTAATDDGRPGHASRASSSSMPEAPAEGMLRQGRRAQAEDHPTDGQAEDAGPCGRRTRRHQQRQAAERQPDRGAGLHRRPARDEARHAIQAERPPEQHHAADGSDAHTEDPPDQDRRGPAIRQPGRPAEDSARRHRHRPPKGPTWPERRHRGTGGPERAAHRGIARDFAHTDSKGVCAVYAVRGGGRAGT